MSSSRTHRSCQEVWILRPVPNTCRLVEDLAPNVVTLLALLVTRHAAGEQRLGCIGVAGAETFALTAIGLRVAVILREVGIAAFGLGDQIEEDLALCG